MRKWKLLPWLSLLFEPRDVWVGVFLDTVKSRLYVLPVPCLGLVIDLPPRGVVVPWLYKWGPVQRIYGVAPNDDRCYFTRVKLTPALPCGQLYLHIFHEAEPNEDPHDHAYDFATMPLGQSYREEVHGDTGTPHHRWHMVTLEPWRWHHRKAEHVHKVVQAERLPLFTLFWQGPARRKWGFHTPSGFVGWKDYIFGGKR